LDLVSNEVNHLRAGSVELVGLFTTGVAIGQRAKGWPDYEVDAIITARIAGKTDEQIRELVKALHAKRAELGTAVPYGL